MQRKLIAEFIMLFRSGFETISREAKEEAHEKRDFGKNAEGCVLSGKSSGKTKGFG